MTSNNDDFNARLMEHQMRVFRGNMNMLLAHAIGIFFVVSMAAYALFWPGGIWEKFEAAL